MARTAVPGGGVHGAVRPPNQTGAVGNRAQNSYLPLCRGSGGFQELQQRVGNDRRNVSAPLETLPSPIHPPKHHFAVDTAKMPQPPSVTELGKGAVPVNPWNNKGLPNQAIPEPDSARQPHK